MNENENDTHFETRHRISVHKLKELLLTLDDDDILVPNRVANLTILRDNKYSGYIDLFDLHQKVTIFEDPDNPYKTTDDDTND